MKASFPLTAADVTRTFDALRLPTPPLARESYTLDQFLRSWPSRAASCGRSTSTSGASATRSVAAPPRSPTSSPTATPTRTIAIESEDAAAVVAAVRSVGLGDYLNTSYPPGLAALLDDRRRGMP